VKNFKNAPRSASETLVSVLSILPKRLLSEITRVGGHRRDFPEGLSEIRVRSYGRSSLVISGENVQLSSAVSPSELLEVYDKALDCALYAHKDEVTRGFISMPRGVRVGISASGRERGALPLDISSLVFRLPSGESESAGGIFSLWQKKRPRGMLIYSEPGGGKTSALRSLAALI